MSLEEAINQMQATIRTACAAAEMKVVRMSDEEARITVLAPASDMQTIKDAAFQPALDFLNQAGLDIQVFVYEKQSG
jgi:hypothetical protein